MGGGEPRRRLEFCPDEPLALEEAGVSFEAAPLTGTPTSMYTHPSVSRSLSRWSSCTSPASLVKDGCVGSMPLSKVHNTFIHSPLPPPTPLRAAASRRSQSLPRNVGSHKNAWEATCRALGCSSALNFGHDYSFNTCDDAEAPGGFAGLVPPSPALTASPTYCNFLQFESRRPLLLSSALDTQDAESEHTPPAQAPAGGSPNVISLASLLHYSPE